ncbi:MAG: 50S ribosomal protein L33 [Patescibacteria group bacterium]|nr:50S ribosomal protein L33 [Patescibacteria group bacterium]
MAKKGKRPEIALVCQECKAKGKTRRNYNANRNVINTPEKLELKKYCSMCRKHTIHKESKLPPSKKQ